MQAAKALKRLKTLHKNLSVATKAIYNCAPSFSSKFSDCYAAASIDTRKQYDEASRAVAEFEADGIRAGLWYRPQNINLLFWVQQRGRIGSVDYI